MFCSHVYLNAIWLFQRCVHRHNSECKKHELEWRPAKQRLYYCALQIYIWSRQWTDKKLVQTVWNEIKKESCFSRRSVTRVIKWLSWKWIQSESHLFYFQCISQVGNVCSWNVFCLVLKHCTLTWSSWTLSLLFSTAFVESYLVLFFSSAEVHKISL